MFISSFMKFGVVDQKLDQFVILKSSWKVVLTWFYCSLGSIATIHPIWPVQRRFWWVLIFFLSCYCLNDSFFFILIARHSYWSETSVADLGLNLRYGGASLSHRTALPRRACSSTRRTPLGFSRSVHARWLDTLCRAFVQLNSFLENKCSMN